MPPALGHVRPEGDGDTEVDTLEMLSVKVELVVNELDENELNS